MSYDIYTGMLKMMDDFGHANRNDISFQFLYEDDGFKALEQKYKISEIAGNTGALSQAVNLLNWVSSNIYHKGNYDNHIANGSIDLLDYSLNKGPEHGINCRSLAILLAECYLSIGLAARPVYMLPFSPYDGDNHVVVSVYIRELNKWIMVDPTYNCYVKDKCGSILSLWECRQALANRDEIFFSDNMTYNNEKPDLNYVKEYYAKDLFYFFCREKFGFNSEASNGGRLITFAPYGFDAKKRNITNIEYRINQWGNNEWLQKWLKGSKEEEILYANINELDKKPIIE